MSDSDLVPFDGFRKRTYVVGAITVVAAGVLLYVVHRLSGEGALECTPSNGGTSSELRCVTEGAQLSPLLSTVLVSILTTILAVGVVALLVEFFLRKKFGSDLLRFLRLDAAVVKSGLSTLGPSTTVQFHAEMETMDSITVLARSPGGWLNEYLPALLRTAQKRKIEMTVALPDPSDADMIAGCGASLGVDPADLAEAIRSFVTSAQSQWMTSLPTLTRGSTLRIVYATQVPSYDAFISNCLCAVFLSKPINHGGGDGLATLVFKDQMNDFPSEWLAVSVDPLKSENEVFSGVKK